MSDLRNISLRHRSLLNSLGNLNLGVPVLAEGTNAGTFKTTAATVYTVNGKIFAKAATDNIAFATAGDAFYTQPVLSTAYYIVLINAAGTVTVLQGRPSTLTALDGNKPGALPNIPDAVSALNAVLGVLKVVVANAATFLPGTTDLSATDVSDTWTDLMAIPAGGHSDL